MRNGNGEQVSNPDTLAKMARVATHADSEEYKLHVFQEVENAYILNFITKSQRDTIFAILFIEGRKGLERGQF